MRLVYGAPVAGFVQHVLGCDDFGKYAAIGVLDADLCLHAGVVFHDWRGRAVEVSLASTRPGWASRGFGRAVLGYAFGPLGVELIWGKTTHPRAVRIARWLNGQVYEIPGLWSVVTIGPAALEKCHG